jgi:hypothetical protein
MLEIEPLIGAENANPEFSSTTTGAIRRRSAARIRDKTSAEQAFHLETMPYYP